MTDLIITPVLDTETASPGDIITIDVNYSTDDPPETPSTGMSLRLHWNSSELEFDPETNLENLFAFGVQPGQVQDDPVEDGGFDGDSDTDKFFLQGWIDTSGNWPNLLDPAPTLYTASFTALEGFSGTTINFSSDQPPGFEFVPTSATIEGEGTDGMSSLSIEDVTVIEGDEGDTTEAVFTVTLSEASDTEVTVEYATTGETASASGGDYVRTDGTLTFAPGETSGTITVEVLGDNVSEDDETFFVNLDNVSDNASIEDGQGVATIENDDDEVIDLPSLSIDDVTVTEGNEGDTTDAVFTVTLSEASDTEVTVEYATTGETASASGGDYVRTDGTLTFAPGETTQTITVEVLGDNVSEADETFFVNLDNVSDNASIEDGQGVATIENDDDEVIDLPSLSIDDVTVAEGNEGDTTDAVFTVTLSEASDTEVTVEYATTGETASASGGDYVRTDGTLTFAPGETTQTITVEVLGDNVSEDDETFFVNLDNVSDNAIIADGQGEATIADDDGPPMPPQIVDVIQGTSLEDTLDGTPQNNVLIGLAGDDIVNAIGGEDLLFGGSGDDNLDGGMGDDLIYGGDGNDLIFGGSGNDTLIGEAGQDFMLGGSGSDIFVLSQDFATPILAQADAIVDFNVEEDAIGLDVGLTRDDIILEGLGTNTAITLAEDNSILAIVNRVTPDQLTDDNFQSVNIGLF